MRKWILAFLIFSASACTVKTLYNQLDWWLADQLQSYVELNDEQQRTLSRHIDQTLLWHKSSQLPLYVKWLQDFKTTIANQPTAAVIEQNLEQLQDFMRTIRAHAAGELAVLLPSLSAAQRQELYAGMEEKNAEFADEFIHLSREQQLAQYIERTQDRFDEWLGSLTTEQQALIKASAEQVRPLASEVLQTRRRWQMEFRRVLDGHKDSDTTTQAMHTLFVNVERLRSEEYQKGMQHNQRVFTQLIVTIARGMTQAQHEYFNSKVDNYSRHFTELAEEARNKLASMPR